MATSGRWQVEGFHDGVWLLHERWAADRDAPVAAEVLHAGMAAARVDEWFPAGRGESSASWLLSEICHDLGGPLLTDEGSAGPLLREAVRRALLDGRLTAIRVLQRAPSDGRSARERDEPRSAPPPAQDEKTWVEVVLLSHGDSKPIPFKRYRIELPDGSVRQGMLDANGAARIAGIDPGTCKVTFPDFHETEWS